MTSKHSASNNELAEANMASDDITDGNYTEPDRDERIFCNTKLIPFKTLRGTCIKTRSDNHEPFITGLCFVPDGQIILCDNSNNKLKLFHEVNGIVRFEITCDSSPYDIAVVDDTKVVVSLPSSAIIRFVDIKPGVKLQDQIDVKGTCYGVAVFEDNIYVCIANQDNSDVSTATDESFCGIKIFSFAGDIKRTIPHTGPGEPNYLSLNKGGTKIYYSGGTDRKAFLSCVTKEGYGLFKYSEDILQNPRSLVVDKEENMVVVDSKTNKLYVVYAAGRSQCLLTKKNKPYKITSICFDRNRGLLGVACSGDIFDYIDRPERLVSKLKIYKLEDQTVGRRMSFIRSVFR